MSKLQGSVGRRVSHPLLLSLIFPVLERDGKSNLPLRYVVLCAAFSDYICTRRIKSKRAKILGGRGGVFFLYMFFFLVNFFNNFLGSGMWAPLLRGLGGRLERDGWVAPCVAYI